MRNVAFLIGGQWRQKVSAVFRFCESTNAKPNRGRAYKNYGADVNLFVDYSQVVQLECLRAGIRETKSLWGRVVTYKE